MMLVKASPKSLEELRAIEKNLVQAEMAVREGCMLTHKLVKTVLERADSVPLLCLHCPPAVPRKGALWCAAYPESILDFSLSINTHA